MTELDDFIRVQHKFLSSLGTRRAAIQKHKKKYQRLANREKNKNPLKRDNSLIAYASDEVTDANKELRTTLHRDGLRSLNTSLQTARAIRSLCRQKGIPFDVGQMIFERVLVAPYTNTLVLPHRDLFPEKAEASGIDLPEKSDVVPVC